MSAFHGLLSVLIWLPIIGGVIVMLVGTDERVNATRTFAFIIAIITLLLCVPLIIGFDPNIKQAYGKDMLQLVEVHHWIPFLNINYNLGVDGFSVLFIVLSCYTNVVVILAAWRTVNYKVGQYLAIFLISTGIMNGCFAATDSILFYFFFEASLVPMYLGIGIWGGKNKFYAGVKFFLYTFLGSIFMLIAFLYLGSKTGSFEISSFINTSLTQTEQNWIFLAFLAAFAVKIPMWPVHTWLPDAHTEAPTGGSVVLAALMLKLGAYGFLRFTLPIVPGISKDLDLILIVVSLIGIVYVGMATVVQKNMKRLIAYSSISHMGMVTLAIFTTFMIIGQKQGHTSSFYDDAILGVQGAIFMMIAHAFTSGALFLGTDYVYRRFKSRDIGDLKGIAKHMPIYASFVMLFAMSNVGLPGTSGFVGEFMIILAVFKAHMWIGLVAGLTLIIAPAYTLWMLKRVIFGVPGGNVLKAANGALKGIKGIKDIDSIEALVFIILAVPIIFFGVYPKPIINTSHETSTAYVQHITQRVKAGTY